MEPYTDPLTFFMDETLHRVREGLWNLGCCLVVRTRIEKRSTRVRTFDRRHRRKQ